MITIVQARMASTRLPGKVLARLGNMTVLEHVIARVREADIGALVIATTWDRDDDQIAQVASMLGIDCFRGHGRDVLQRFRDCNRKHEGDPIVRVTADCPFLDPGLLAQVAAKLQAGGFDYVGVKGAPDGYHQEAFTAAALKLANALATDQFDREHVVTYMLSRPAMFRQGWVQAAIEGPPVTLDTAEDLERLRKLVARAA